MINWLELLGDKRPTEDRLWNLWKKKGREYWFSLTQEEKSEAIRWERHAVAHRRIPERSIWPDPHCWRWPGYERALGPRPDEGDLFESILQAWYAAHPQEKRPNQRRLGHVSLRFQVFQRDNFQCRYCGRSAPEVVLHADHVVPVSKGGKDTLENLVTSCRECNLGKRDVLLVAAVPATEGGES